MFTTISSLLYLPHLKNISKTRALLWCILITLLVMAIEFYYGGVAHSLMLVSDGFHMLTHALSLALTLISRVIAHQTNNRRAEAIAVTVNAFTLLYFGIYISYEAVLRMMAPEVIVLSYTLVVALVGFIVNILTAIILNQAGIEDLNTRSAFAHMIADTLSSVSIVAGTLIIYVTGWYIVDGILSMIVAALVIKWAADLLRSLISEWSLFDKSSVL